MLLSSAAADFLRYCAVERQLSQYTVQAYAADLADFRRSLPAGALAEEVNVATLQAYLAELVGMRKLSVATIRRRFACLRAFFRKLVRQSDVPDPFSNWRL